MDKDIRMDAEIKTSSVEDIIKMEKTAATKGTKDIMDVSEPEFRVVDMGHPEGVAKEAMQILKEEKESAIVKIASFDGRFQDPYPSPFLNLSDTQIPKTTAEIFKWCKYFYTFDPLIAGAINALATFPITEIYLEDKESADGDEETDDCKLYKRIFFKSLNMYKLLIEIGIDYFLYGNCFVFGELWTNPSNGGIEWKSMIRLDPSKVIIDYNPATQEKKYKWQVPARLVDMVRKKKPAEEYDKIPEVIREAVIKNNAILLNSNNVFHFSRPTDSMGDNNIWGTPVIANVLKLLMYRNILRQAQEAIAREHIVPMRVYYLDSTKDYNINADWNAIADSFAGELNKAVKDPNHKVVSPIPVNLLNVGGEGKSLMLTPEIEQVQAEILAGMNVPREFLFGGISYSGSSISLKILENQFITYRLLLKDFMQNFVIKNMAKARGEWINEKDDETLISVKLVDLKMQDDVQQKQLIISLNQNGKITNDYMWKVIGVDPEKMKISLEKEALDNIDFQTKLQMKQMDEQLKVQKRQLEIQAELQRHQSSLMPQIDPMTGTPTAAPGVPIDPITGQAPGLNPGMPADPNAQQQNIGQGTKKDAKKSDKTKNTAQAAQTTQQGEITNPADDEAKMQAIAVELVKVPESQQQAFLAKLPSNYRARINQIMNQLKSAQPSGNTENSKVEAATKTDMRPMPEQKPPRRDSVKS